MRISFDLDDTLICHQPTIPKEETRVPFFLRWWLSEPLRKGTAELFTWLKASGHEVGVYTTSYRSKLYIKWLFRCYGITLCQIVNQLDHEQRFIGKLSRVASKMPTVFGFHLHIDDDQVLNNSALSHGLTILRIDPYDADWISKVKDFVVLTDE